jgi:hypothetical protein
MGAGRDPVVTEISVVESNLCSTLSTGRYFDAETQRANAGAVTRIAAAAAALVVKLTR